MLSSDSGQGESGKKVVRGFAAMDPKRQREIASRGGRAAHASGNAHVFSPAEAAAAGRKSRRGAVERRTQQGEATSAGR